MSSRRRTLLVLVGALLAFPEVGHAAVVRTACFSGCAYTTLGAAINASSAGDGIEVMAGTYNEQVVVD
jgi:pectin methylesterase-like acyl-CoA thioesterase